jgi:hypothetical protein
MQRDTLDHRLRTEGYEPVGDPHVENRYSKRVELTQRPDWALGEDGEGPWIEFVECEADDPDASMVLTVMEVACAPAAR